MNATVAGGHLFYVTHGRGSPMLVLHGSGLDHTSLRPWLDPLGADVELIYYDQLGSGRSSEPADWAAVSRQSWVEDADGLREYLGHERVLLFGHSYGGYLAQEYALRYPDRVLGLVLCCTAAAMDFPEVMMANARARATPAQYETLVRGLSGPLPDDATLGATWTEVVPIYFADGDPELAAAVLRDVRYRVGAFNHAFFRCLSDFDTRPQLSRLDVPTLILAGRHDWITPPREGSEPLHSRIPNARLVVFEKSGHFPFAEEPARFIETVSDFVRSLP
jgi:proline iminopeptidase